MSMYSRKDIPKDSPYFYQKQIRDAVDADIDALRKDEATNERANEKIEKAKDRIEERKNAEYANQQNARNYRISLWSFIVAVVALIVSLISLFRGS